MPLGGNFNCRYAGVLIVANHGGNPPNPQGLKTDYLWRHILARESLTDIIENFAAILETPNPQTGLKEYKQVFPRYHQLDVVRKLLEHARFLGAGQRYLIQHSAGSGKSNSIAWLALQLVGLEKESKQIFDTAIVVTDRTVLDDQIAGTLRAFAQMSNVLGHANDSSDLRSFLTSGKKIVITTVQKFPFILEEIGSSHRNRTFAILIDEAHSSQSGETAAKMNRALSAEGEAGEDESYEDQVNRVMESRKMLPNASYFAFTATPKAKTLETFGTPSEEGGQTKRRAFHQYTMKQAIDEGFILDVLSNYTPVSCYYSLTKTIEEDPEFDVSKANKKLRRYVESHDHAVRMKAEIMVDHFQSHVVAPQKIGGEARAMVVTGSIERAIQYWEAFNSYLKERHLPHKAIVAFSGEPEYKGQKVTEASLNGFSSKKIASEFQKHPYRFLICADKFQTGYDEPLLHTMYVDKALSGIKAVQTLSRLNRSHPKKKETFVLDFQNDTDTIREAFSDYYRTTILSGETDPNKLHNLKSDIERHQVYSQLQVDTLVERYLADSGGKKRDQIDPILDSCVATYIETLDEDAQVDFKGNAKAFVRTYGFLASILPYSVAAWEKLSIFLNFLIPKLPTPIEPDLSAGILKALDMESYRAEAQATIKIAIADENAEIEPAPTSAGGRAPEPEMNRLSQIIRSFNERFGNFPGKTAEETQAAVEEISAKVDEDKRYKNARKNSDKQNSRIEMETALQRAMVGMMVNQTELFKKYQDDPGFKSGLAELIFSLTYNRPAGESLNP